MPIDRAALARSKDALVRAFLTVFSSQRNANYGVQAMHNARMYDRGKSKAYTKAGGAEKAAEDAQIVMTTRLLPWVIVGLLQTGRMSLTMKALEKAGIYIPSAEEDEKENFWWDFFVNFSTNYIGDRGMILSKIGNEARKFNKPFGAMGILPGAVRVFDAWKKYYEAGGEEYKAESKYGKKGQKKGTYLLKRLSYEAMMFTSSMLGIGEMNAVRDGLGAWYWMSGEAENAEEKRKEEARKKELLKLMR